jgi:hypothetical protein
MHEECVTKLLLITSKHMQQVVLPMAWMPSEIEVGIVADAGAYPYKFMFCANAFGQSD